MDIKILKDMFLTIERSNPLKCQDQTIHKRIMVYPGLLKCGKVEMESTIDQGNLIKNSWDSLGKVDPHRGEHLLGRTAHSARKRRGLFTTERGDPLQRMSKETLILKSSSWEVTQQNLSIKVRNQVRIRQKRMSKRCRGLYRTFDNLGNVYGYNIECSDIHGKRIIQRCRMLCRMKKILH